MENKNFSSGLSDNKDYNAALEYLYNRLPMFSRVGGPAYKPGLETSIELAAAFGNPQKKFRSVHVGGTNGKGSVSHSLASVLQEGGYKVGLYTSPHLVDFRERIRINGQMIPHREVVDFVERWKSLDYAGSPSFFELTMIMAFEWFAKEEVDVAVIEVGMGGRLDSTNIIEPEMCVITNISKDHTQFLGTTLEAIAGEKSGIIKSGVPVVIGESEGRVRDVFARKAEEVGTSIDYADDHTEMLDVLGCAEDAGWRVHTPLAGEFTFPLGGEYQKRNLRTVLVSLAQLSHFFPAVGDPEVIAHGLEKVVENTGLMGRWMVMGRQPLMICDTGHNEAGLRHNLGQLKDILSRRPGGELRMVMGFVADKAIDEILAMMPRDAKYYLSNARIPRALPVGELEVKCKGLGLNCQAYPTVGEAVEAAKRDSSVEDLLYIGGSTFIVADYLDTLS